MTRTVQVRLGNGHDGWVMGGRGKIPCPKRWNRWKGRFRFMAGHSTHSSCYN